MILEFNMDKIAIVRNIVENTDGLFFNITFVKKNGEIRNLTGRTGVTKHLTPNPRICMNGTSDTVAHKEEYIKVYDTIKKGYRNVNMETVTYFKCGDVEIEFK